MHFDGQDKKDGSDQLTHSSRNYLALRSVNYAKEWNNERLTDRRTQRKGQKERKRVLIKRQ